MPVRQHIIESGDPSMQRAMDGVFEDMSGLSAEDIAYTPGDSSDWVSPAPTTVKQALDRLAAAGGATPVP